MRLFLALELTAATLSSMDDAIAPLHDLDLRLGFTAPEKRHLTLKFIGEGTEAQVESIAASMDQVASRHRPFVMALGGVGAFPNFRRARVVWIGVEAEARLELLHHDLEVACGDAGIEVEGRPFRPHVTLARLRAAPTVEQARALARAARCIAYSAMQDVTAITLFDSVPGSPGAHYRRLHTATLGGR